MLLYSYMLLWYFKLLEGKANNLLSLTPLCPQEPGDCFSDNGGSTKGIHVTENQTEFLWFHLQPPYCAVRHYK